MSATDDREEPALTGSGGDDVSAGIITSSTGGRSLDDDQEPGHGDLDEVIANGRSQPEHRAETG